jgi:uncharacterized protein (DUF2164 family)
MTDHNEFVLDCMSDATYNSILEDIATSIEDMSRAASVVYISQNIKEIFYNRGITLSFSSEEELDSFAETMYDSMSAYLQDQSAPYAKGEK